MTLAVARSSPNVPSAIIHIHTLYHLFSDRLLGFVLAWCCHFAISSLTNSRLKKRLLRKLRLSLLPSQIDGRVYPVVRRPQISDSDSDSAELVC
jgi:hypothetical protein